MGYDLNRFVEEVDEELRCPICTMVLENGVQSQHCEHTYCDLCIKEWIKFNQICPNDRTKLTLVDIRPIPRILRNLLQKLEIKCDFEPRGCMAVIKLENLESHHKSCSFNPNMKITCNKKCGLEMTKEEFETHNCFRKLASVVVAQQKRISYLETELKKHSWYGLNGLSVIYDTIQCTNKDFGSYTCGLAQHQYPLSESDPYFELEVIDTGVNEIELGLSRYRLKDINPNSNSIYYNGNEGFAYTFLLTGRITAEQKSLPKWRNGDTVGCGIKSLNTSSVVYFTRNKQIVYEISANLSEFGLYPTFRTNSVGAKVIVKLF